MAASRFHVIAIALLILTIYGLNNVYAVTIFECFDSDPADRNWQSQSSDNTRLVYNSQGYLDASVCREAGQKVGYSYLLQTPIELTDEFWFEMDCQLSNGQTDSWGRALFGVFNASADHAEFVGCRFASPQVNNRYDLWRQVSDGSYQYFNGPAPIPDHALIRVKGHYWKNNNNGYAQIEVVDIVSGVVYGSTGPQVVYDATAGVVFNQFGLCNRTDGGLTSPTVFKVDNLYFSTEGPNTNTRIPSFYDPWQGKLTLSDVFAVARADSLTVQTRLKNESSQPLTATIRYRVYENESLDHAPFLEIIEGPLTVPAGGEQVFESHRNQLQPELWSPETPNLYLLTTEILDTSMNQVISHDTAIGFRTFEVAGKHFHLNGKPIYLFSFHRMPPGRIPSAVHEDSAFIAQHIARLKALNVNFVRLNEGASPAWFEACDRAGIMVMAGCYSGAGRTDPSLWQSNLERLQAEIPRVRNHASVCMWILGNEWNFGISGMRQAAEDLYHATLELDSSRPMFNTWTAKYYNGGDLIAGTGSDFLDYHTYTGWYGGSVYDLYKYHIDEDFPVTISECVGAYTALDPYDMSFAAQDNKIFDKYLANLLRNVGHSYDLSNDSLSYQTYLTRELVEMCRRFRSPDSSMCGAMPFTNGYAYHCYYDSKDITEIAKPVMDSLGQAYRPVHISIRIPYPNLYAGDSTTVRFFVLNDDRINYNPLLPASMLELDLIDPLGKVVWHTSNSVPDVPYYSSWDSNIPINVPASGIAGDYEILARLVKNGQEIVRSSSELTVARPGWAVVRSLSYGAVALYDPANTTRDELQALGLKFQLISNFNNLSGYQYLIIGKNGFDGSVSAAEATLASFIDGGHRILVLEQESSSAETAFDNAGWLGTHLTLSGADKGEDFVNMERPWLVNLMDGLERGDFRIWNRHSSAMPQDRALFSRYYELEYADLDSVAVLANAGHHLYKAILVEIFSQTGTGGSCLCSQLRTIDRYKTDPKADKYLANLLDYFLESDRHYHSVQVGHRIDFGDFASEKGLIFAPMLQGMAVAYHGGPFYLPGNGRDFRGQMKIENSLGYLEEDNPADMERCPMYLRCEQNLGCVPVVVEVENAYSSPLGFRIIVNDWSSERQTIQPGVRTQLAFELPALIPAGTPIKLQIEADEGEHYHGGSRGLIFHNIQLHHSPGDLNGDERVDRNDLVCLLDRWLATGLCLDDYDGDNKINLNDYRILAKNWQLW